MSKLKRDLIISSSVTLVLLVAYGFRAYGTETGIAAILNNKWFQLAAALTVQLFAGARFYNSLRLSILALMSKIFTSGNSTNSTAKPRVVFLNGGASVDILVAAASAPAFILSFYNVFLNPDSMSGMLCFESPSALVTLALLGEYLEKAAAARVPESVKRLASPRAETAVVRRGGAELEIPAGQVVTGDIVIVRSGGLIPADGEILNGLAGVDESAFTGKTGPVDKQPGDKVYAASVCVYGSFEMLAENVGADSALSRVILSLSRPCDGKRLVFSAFRDILGYYVPVSIFLSFAVFVWQWLYTGELLPAITGAVSALMAACPCALGLAAPAVIRNVTGKAAENGIFFTGDKCFGNLRTPDVVLLAKTGVITDGRPEITDIIAFSGFFEEEIVSFAASAAKNSSHPIDKAVYDHTQPKVIMGGLTENVVRSGSDELVTLRSKLHGFIGSVPEADEFKRLPGYGIQAVIGGREVLLGSRGLLRGNGVDISGHEKILAELESAGKTVTLAAIGRKAAGVIATYDTIRDGAPIAVQNLKSLGMEVYLLTGGSARTSKAIGRRSGIDNIISDVLPKDKAAGIARLKEAGKTVAVIGCGASDAPALAAADLGMTTGLDESADVTLIHGGLERACNAVSLSNAASRQIRRNLLISFAFSAAGVILAAAGAFPPAVMAASASFSALFILTNSMRQR